MTGHYFQAKINFFENEKGLTLVELIVLMIILALLSTLAIPRFIDLELCSEQEAIEKGISGLNGWEKLVRAPQIISTSGLVQRIIPEADLSPGPNLGQILFYP